MKQILFILAVIVALAAMSGTLVARSDDGAKSPPNCTGKDCTASACKDKPCDLSKDCTVCPVHGDCSKCPTCPNNPTNKKSTRALHSGNKPAAKSSATVRMNAEPRTDGVKIAAIAPQKRI